MKILFTCYYELKDALRLASKYLSNFNHDVLGFPLFRYYADINDKTPEYTQLMIDCINENSIDVILWWYFSIPTSDMEIIVKACPSVKNIMFNWDEPYNWKDCDIQNKSKFFDAVFVTCAEKLNDYVKYGTKEAFLQFPGYDSSVHNIIINDDDDDIVKKYTCDISICCTNLYDNDRLYPNQYIKRKELVDKIYECRKKYGYSFKIFGPEKFRDIYPESYAGFVNYQDTNKVYNYSKINICTHVQYNTYKYLNERTINILGSGGLLLVDKVDGIDEILTPNVECLILDKNNYIEQIVQILSNYDDYLMIRHNANAKSKLYTWEKWASNINEYLKSLKNNS